ncbi:MAG: hypothetical protein AAB896_03235 [Patescibacteria group bacterium]
MKHRNRHLVLPAVLSAGSFIGLILIMLLSDPVQNVSYALFFFTILLVFLLSLGHLLLGLFSRKISRKLRPKILIISVLLVIILMFRSAGSLNWVDILVMLLLSGGLLFYSGRRIH